MTAIAVALFILMAAGPGSAQGGQSCRATTTVLRYKADHLRTYSTLELLSFFTAESQEQNRGMSGNYLDDIKKEIVTRRPLKELVCVLETSDSFPQLGYTSDLLTKVADHSLDSRLKSVATADISERAYFALIYFARRGDVWALERLNAHFYQYPVPSVVWTEAVDLLGKYRYLPAARNLAQAVHSVSLDMAEACLRNLELMFPDSHPRFSTLLEAREYWKRYVAEHTK